MPRAMPESCSAFFRSISGFSAVSIWKFTKRSARAATLSRAGPVSCSSASRMTRGLSASSVAASVPTGAPIQRSMPSEASAMSPLPDAENRSRAAVEFQRQRFLRGGLDRLAVLAAGGLVGGETKPLKFADMMALDDDRSGRRLFLLQASHFLSGGA